MPAISVASMVTQNGNWLWSAFAHLLSLHVQLRLIAIKCPIPTFPSDSITWVDTTMGVFTVKSAYVIRRGLCHGPVEDIWKIRQHFRGTQRMRIFLWLVCQGRIMTNQERIRRYFSTDAGCHLCNAETEDINHVLRKCPHAFLVWHELITLCLDNHCRGSGRQKLCQCFHQWMLRSVEMNQRNRVDQAKFKEL
ncbi:hypothetical protein V6N13_048420 [Hibiscus sabdariffa]